MPRPTRVDYMGECACNVEDKMAACASAIYCIIGDNICRLLCHFNTGCAHTAICFIIHRHLHIYINNNIVIDKLHDSRVMVLEEHRLSIHYYWIPTNNLMLVIHNAILHQPSHHLFNNCLRHIDQNPPQKVSNMDS